MITVAFDIDKTLLTLSGGPIDNLIKTLINYKNAGYKIVIITARYPQFHNYTKAQLDSIGLSAFVDLDNDIYYTGGKSKMRHLINNGVVVFFDDYCQNMIDIIENKHLLPQNFKLYQVIKKDGKFKIFDTKMKYVIMN